MFPEAEPINKARERKSKSKKPWKARKLVKEIDTGIEVEVSNPTITNKKIGKYVKYDVSGNDKNGNFNCKRRYNAFKELRVKLCENWPGIFIPPLPEKKKIVRFIQQINRFFFFFNFFLRKN